MEEFNLQVSCSDQNSIKLLSMVLYNKTALNFNEEELKAITNQYWSEFKRGCSTIDDESDEEKRTKFTTNMATVLKLIFDYKDTPEFIQLLTEVEDVSERLMHTLSRGFQPKNLHLQEIKSNGLTQNENQQFKILASMAKCQLNKVKGQVSTYIGRRAQSNSPTPDFRSSANSSSETPTGSHPTCESAMRICTRI